MFHKRLQNKYSEVIDINSKEYKKYKDDVEKQINVIQLMLVLEFYTLMVLLIVHNGEALLFWSAVTGLSGAYIWNRKSKGHGFWIEIPSDPVWIRDNISDKDRKRLLKSVRNDLNIRFNAIKIIIKITKWLFLIVVVGTYEDGIKSFSNVTTWSGLITFIMVISLLLVSLVSHTVILGKLFEIIVLLKNNVTLKIDNCIRHGIFMDNFALLFATENALAKTKEDKANMCSLMHINSDN